MAAPRRNLGRAAPWAVLAAALWLPASPAASQLADGRWLPPGSDLGAALSREPREVLRVVEAGGRAPFAVRLGRLAFRSPLVLGGKAGRLGLSCNTCHPNGAANRLFFVAGVSDRPGNVDVAHRFFDPKADDGRAVATNIPSLRGLRWQAPYGRDGRFPGIAQFTRNVIVNEFGGRVPHPAVLDALVAYQFEFDFPANPNLGPGGRLRGSVPAAARLGEARFADDCAGCHIPSAGFIDRLSHDVGTGELFDTPSLRGLTETAPYFHDGRAADLADVVDHFDRVQGLGYTKTARAELVAYLTVIGAGAGPDTPITAAGDIDRLVDFAGLAMVPLHDEDAALADLIVDLVRIEIGRVHERFPDAEHAAQQATLIAWSRQLAEVGKLAAAGAFPAARHALTGWQTTVAADRGLVESAARTSLYNPALLGARQ